MPTVTVKLINVLPQSLPGNLERHYGQSCEIRQDGVYCDIDQGLAELFVATGKCEKFTPAEKTKAEIRAEEKLRIQEEAKLLETLKAAAEKGEEVAPE